MLSLIFAGSLYFASLQLDSYEIFDFGSEGALSEIEDLLLLDVDELSLEDLLFNEIDLDLLEIED